MRTIILTGGGTAGHIMPNIALLDELSKHFGNIIYLGGEGMEREIAASYNLPYYSTACIRLQRERKWSNAKIPFVLIKGVRQAKRIFESVKPDVVFSKGGYAALPACLVAWLKRVPLVVHESDYTLGVANKLSARFAAAVLTSFRETKGGQYVGNLIKEDIALGNARVIKNRYNLSGNPTILVMGGSVGSQAINTIVYQAVPTLIQNYNVIHITGKNGDSSVAYPNYFQESFVGDIQHYYAAADLVISRGGANSLAEIAANGIRNIVIPLPKGNSRGDQEQNAKSWHKLGQVEILTQANLTCASLLSAIEETFSRPAPPKVDSKLVVKEVVSAIVKSSKTV